MKTINFRDSEITNTFRASKYDNRTKLTVPVIEKFPAVYGDTLYFYRDNEEIEVTTSPLRKGHLLFKISVDVENRARLTETNLKKIGATFGDRLEFLYYGLGKAIVRVLPQRQGHATRPNTQRPKAATGTPGGTILPRPVTSEKAGITDGGDWSSDEVRLAVDSYFQMLTKELKGEDYRKTEFRNALLARINRTRGAVEYKYQNISAALVAKGLPYIEGYKPASNYQTALDDAIDGYIETRPEFLHLVAQAIEDTVAESPATNFINVLEDPPAQTEKEKDEAERKRSYQARKYDFTQRENQKLGRLGEEFVEAYERQRLMEVGKSDLAKKVERISETRGDGAGYDVLSFEDDGTERYIEVKTTNSGKNYPFYISANELDFSEDFAEKYYLYRVFNFKKSPKLFMLRGSLKGRYEVTPIVFRVSF
ncbi:MAG: DUF3883 domain-containing protein [Pyrinomonadaceae bacterium]